MSSMRKTLPTLSNKYWAENMYEIIYTGQFKKSLRLCVRRGLDINALTAVIDILQEKGELPSEYNPHKLKGKYRGCWECHISPTGY